MSNTTYIGLLVIGVLLLVLGVEAYRSSASMISRSMTGAPTDNVLWLIISGLLVEITAIFGLINTDSKSLNK